MIHSEAALEKMRAVWDPATPCGAERRARLAVVSRRRWLGRLPIPENAHPLVRGLFQEMNRQRVSISDIAERSGLAAATISDWRYTRNPTVPNLEAALNALGCGLAIVRNKDRT